MAKCPFSVWMPLPWNAGRYINAPYKIIHHTTEGSTAQSAFDTYEQKHDIPHFTVDATHIYQHIDTELAATALEHPSGTVETNRSNAIQFELVGFAGRTKNREALRNAGRLCRWLEQLHNIPKVWPSGFPRPAVNGKDPGGHNRDEASWRSKSGHYGHCHVPNNHHWDPAYTKDEVEFLMGVELDESPAPALVRNVRAALRASGAGAGGEAIAAGELIESGATFADALTKVLQAAGEGDPRFGGLFPHGINFIDFSVAEAGAARIVMSSQAAGSAPALSNAHALLALTSEGALEGFSERGGGAAPASSLAAAMAKIPGTDYPAWALARDVKTARTHYGSFITASCERFGLDEAVVLAIGSKESQWGLALRPAGPAGTGDWTPRSSSRWGVAMPTDGLGWGRGLMQIDWHSQDFAKTGAWRDPEQNISFGCGLLREKIDGFIRRRESAADALLWGVSAYNGASGPHSLYCNDVMARAAWIGTNP